MQRVSLIIFALGLAKCTGSAFAYVNAPPPAEEMTPAEKFNSRWTGKTEDDVIVQYGKPHEVLQLSNGNHVDSYHREIFVSSASGLGLASGGTASNSYRADATTIDCDRRFEIDQHTGRILRAVITGSRCDYSR